MFVNCETPDDVECCKSPVNGELAQSPGTADDTHATLPLTKSPDAITTEEHIPIPYEPLLGDILGDGSTSRIARIAPGVIIKCPRFSRWHSVKAPEKWFVRDMKRGFEVEERLLKLLGLHPRIVESVAPSIDLL